MLVSQRTDSLVILQWIEIAQKTERGRSDSHMKRIWIVLILPKKDRDRLDSHITDKCRLDSPPRNGDLFG